MNALKIHKPPSKNKTKDSSGYLSAWVNPSSKGLRLSSASMWQLDSALTKQCVCLCVCARAAGLNPNMNVNCMEVGGLSLKEPSQPQSRLSQWTHSNSMDSLPGNSSNIENNLCKHGKLNTNTHLHHNKSA